MSLDTETFKLAADRLGRRKNESFL